MKLVQLLFVLTLFMTIASCSDDEPDTPEVFSPVGTWNLTSFEYDVSMDSMITELADSSGFLYDSTIYTNNTMFVGTGKNMSYTLTFTENPNESSSSGTFDVDITRTKDNQSYSYEELGSEIDANGIWLKTGNNIIIRDSGNSFVNAFEVMELNATTLKLKHYYIYSLQDQLTNTKKQIKVYTVNNILTLSK